MGGRNAYSASSKSIVSKQYHTIGTDGKMTFIQSHVERPKDPIRSNLSNPIYVIVENDGSIKNIYFYKNHKVVKSIDFKHGSRVHAHRWKTVFIEKKGYYSSERINQNLEHLPLTKRELLYWHHAEEFLSKLNKV